MENKKVYRIGAYKVELVKDGAVTLEGEDKKCDRPERVAALVRQFIGNTTKEHFVAIFVNSRNNIIGINLVSMGTASASLVHPRHLFQPAILANAIAVIISHNHPSGDVSPSTEDRET